MNKKESICVFEMDFKTRFVGVLILVMISLFLPTLCLKTGVENDKFCLSEIGSRFGEPGGTSPPRIPRSTLPPRRRHERKNPNTSNRSRIFMLFIHVFYITVYCGTVLLCTNIC